MKNFLNLLMIAFLAYSLSLETIPEKIIPSIILLIAINIIVLISTEELSKQ